MTRLDPERALVLGGPPKARGTRATWAFYLLEGPHGTTRLLERGRSVAGKGLLEKLGSGPYLIEPIGFVMSRKMVQTIKRLAEESARGPGVAGAFDHATETRPPWSFARTCGSGCRLHPSAPRLVCDVGAKPEEVTRGMPGDELIPEPDMLATRAITVHAPPSAIWPWLVQMGSGRGGAYTYDWIENIFGLDMHSADEILPQFQDLEVGDVLPMGAEQSGYAGRDPSAGALPDLPLRGWDLGLDLRPLLGGRQNEAVSRNRISALGAKIVRRLVNLLFMEPGSLVMERKMLIGIKERAERRAQAYSSPGEQSARATRRWRP